MPPNQQNFNYGNGYLNSQFDLSKSGSNFGNLQGFSLANPASVETGPPGLGNNFQTYNLLANGFQGIGSLAKGYAAIKQLGLAKDTLNFQKDAYNQNYNASRTTINNRLRDQNAFKTAQGRTDLANLVV